MVETNILLPVTTDLSLLPRTDRECHVCEEGVFVRDGFELVCNNCQHSPSYNSGLTVETNWEQHRRQVDAAEADDERPRLVGGYHDAYWARSDEEAGAYEYSPSDGFLF